ncbi:hypothetical protein HHK36_032389 [Tetracentron sinense]|uniref:Uncharacterized protein n=1 Tax=Tetracentron sinense TaxID=13715 RepID=A0A834Y9A0_TETSI|nr:hypothetical protein HHK36_032389 [Tetracentron sinense]
MIYFFYVPWQENGFLHVPKGQAQNPQAQKFSDPNMAVDMMKKNLSMIIPQTLTFAWVNFFFSSFVADPLYTSFHDDEWGVPIHDDRKLFELLVLSEALAELSWPTILNKRDLFRIFEALDFAQEELAPKCEERVDSLIAEHESVNATAATDAFKSPRDFLFVYYCFHVLVISMGSQFHCFVYLPLK